MKLTLLTLLAGFLAYGCATAPRAQIANGLYANKQYRFSIKTPEGWNSVQRLPRSFRPPGREFIQAPSGPAPNMTPGAIAVAPSLEQFTTEWKFSPTQFSDLLLFNETERGAIVIKADRIRSDWSRIPPQQIGALVAASLQQEAKLARISQFIDDDTYDVFPEAVTAKPAFVGLVRLREVARPGMKPEGILPLQHEIRYFLFTLSDGSTCRLKLALISDEATFPKNQRVFDKFVLSLTRVE